MTPARKTTDAAVSTRDAVFDSAASQFARGGFDGVSVDDIRESVGWPLRVADVVSVVHLPSPAMLQALENLPRT